MVKYVDDLTQQRVAELLGGYWTRQASAEERARHMQDGSHRLSEVRHGDLTLIHYVNGFGSGFCKVSMRRQQDGTRAEHDIWTASWQGYFVPGCDPLAMHYVPAVLCAVNAQSAAPLSLRATAGGVKFLIEGAECQYTPLQNAAETFPNTEAPHWVYGRESVYVHGARVYDGSYQAGLVLIP